MNKKYEKTLARVLTKPTRSDLTSREIEAMLISLGAEIREGNGSRIRVKLNGCVASFHRPHPVSEWKKGAVDALRKFLKDSGF